VEAKAQQALDCEQDGIELAATAVAPANLNELSPNVPPSLTNPTMPSTSGTFKAAEDAKAIWVDAEDPAKSIQVGADLSLK
jgi:hypothetical protein